MKNEIILEKREDVLKNNTVSNLCIYYKGKHLTYTEVAIKLMELDKIKETLKKLNIDYNE